MWQTFVFGMHWRHEGTMYYDELPADSKEETAEYFIDHKRDDVTLVRIELIDPDDFRCSRIRALAGFAIQSVEDPAQLGQG